MFNTAGARIIKGVTLCLSVMYKLISGTDALRLGITFTGDNGKYYIAYIKTADQLEIKQRERLGAAVSVHGPPAKTVF